MITPPPAASWINVGKIATGGRLKMSTCVGIVVDVVDVVVEFVVVGRAVVGGVVVGGVVVGGVVVGGVVVGGVVVDDEADMVDDVEVDDVEVDEVVDDVVVAVVVIRVVATVVGEVVDATVVVEDDVDGAVVVVVVVVAVVVGGSPMSACTRTLVASSISFQVVPRPVTRENVPERDAKVRSVTSSPIFGTYPGRVTMSSEPVPIVSVPEISIRSEVA
jgi:hypothetical protein